MKTVLASVISFLLLVSFHGVELDVSIYQQLYKNLTTNYVPARPGITPLQVLSATRLFQIISLDGKSEVLTFTGEIGMIWFEPLLSWNETDYPVRFMNLPAEQIWLPDIYIANSAREARDELWYKHGRVLLEPSGGVVWKINSDFSTTCSLDMTSFPFDRQTCYIDIAMQISLAQEVQFEANVVEVLLDQYTENGEWNVVSTSAKADVYEYDSYIGPLDLKFSYIRLELNLERKSTYFFVSVLLPCIFLSSITLLVFFLPPASGEKMSLSITVFLTFNVFMLLVSDMMPQTSTHTPLLAKYIMAVIATSMLALVSSILVLICHHQNDSTPIPGWLARCCNLKKQSTGKVTPHNGSRVSSNGLDNNSDDAVSKVTSKWPQEETLVNDGGKDEGTNHVLRDLMEGITKSLRVLEDIRSNTFDATYNQWHEVANKLDKIFLVVFLLAVITVNVWFFAACLS